MKQSQLTIAVLVLAVMVFVVTFAMNYLGGGGSPSTHTTQPDEPTREVLFANKVFPVDAPYFEREDKGTGHQDYWFFNTNDKPVKLGLNSQNCKCTSVEVYVLSEEASRQYLGGKPVESPDKLAERIAPLQSRTDLESQAQSKALAVGNEYIEAPAGSLGWVRLRYKGEKSGQQTVGSKIWMDNSRTGQLATLELRLMFYEPLRVNPFLSVGTISDDDLNKGVKRYLYCWSSTRKSLKVDVQAVRTRGDAGSDPMEVGVPEPLDDKERAELEQTLTTPNPNQADQQLGGRVLCGYKVPITLHAISPDGKMPFDIGPFRRRVLLSSPDLEGEPKTVEVTGRVRGFVEIGGDEEGGAIHFRDFPRSRGRRIPVPMHCENKDVKLEVDRSRMPEFLNATLKPVETSSKTRQSWTLLIEVLPNKASGPFPRKEPLYEDSAVYLKATVPGKPPRYLRIAVQGTASEA